MTNKDALILALTIRRIEVISLPLLGNATLDDLPDRYKRLANEYGRDGGIDMLSIIGAEDVDLIVAAAVRRLRRKETGGIEAMLDVLGYLDTNRKLAFYALLIPKARRRLERHPDWSAIIAPWKDAIDKVDPQSLIATALQTEEGTQIMKEWSARRESFEPEWFRETAKV
jgi:hypothetical protein